MPFSLQSTLACDRPHPLRFLLEDVWESHCHGLPRGPVQVEKNKRRQTKANRTHVGTASYISPQKVW